MRKKDRKGSRPSCHCARYQSDTALLSPTPPCFPLLNLVRHRKNECLKGEVGSPHKRGEAAVSLSQTKEMYYKIIQIHESEHSYKSV